MYSLLAALQKKTDILFFSFVFFESPFSRRYSYCNRIKNGNCIINQFTLKIHQTCNILKSNIKFYIISALLFLFPFNEKYQVWIFCDYLSILIIQYFDFKRKYNVWIEHQNENDMHFSEYFLDCLPWKGQVPYDVI